MLFVFGSPLFYVTPFTHSFKSIISADADRFFRQYIDLLHQGATDRAYHLLSPDAQKVVPIKDWQTLSNYFAQSTDQMALIDEHVSTRSSEGSNRSITTYNVYYEIQNNHPIYKYLIAEIAAQDAGTGLQILGVHITGFTQSAEERGKFNFATQSVYLIPAIFAPLFIAYTAFRYITKAKKPRWILLLVILFVTLYVTSQGGGFALGLSLGVYGFMGKAAPWGPWAFATPVPLGAIFYYFVRGRCESSNQ